MQLHLNALNMAAAGNLLRPVLQSPICHVVISFALGYYATNKIGQWLAIKLTLNKASNQNEINMAEKSKESALAKSFIVLTRHQLSNYDGHRADLPIYTALNGSIYDLSTSREEFSNHGPYSLLAGCDANHVLCIACASMGVNTDNVVERWERSLNAKYNIVGYLLDARITDEEQDSGPGCSKGYKDHVLSTLSECEADATSEV